MVEEIRWTEAPPVEAVQTVAVPLVGEWTVHTLEYYRNNNNNN